MRFHWTALACLASLGLAGCEATGQPTIQVSDLSAPAPVQGQAEVSPDIRRILSAGGLDKAAGGRPAAPPTQALLAAAADPKASAAVAVTQPTIPMAALVADNHRGRHGKGKDPLPAPAAVASAAPAPVPETLAAPAAAALEPLAYAPPAVQRGPDGSLPALSPLSPPPTNVRLPSVAGPGLATPPGPAAPQYAVTQSQPIDFVNGVQPLGQPAGQPRYQVASYAPQYAPQFPPGGAVEPVRTAQQVLQPLLDPNNLVSQPRFTSRSHAQVVPYGRKVAVGPIHAPPRPRAVAAAEPAAVAPAPRPAAPPPPRDDGPTVRRF